MTAQLFDAVAVVDWSAAAKPATGADSIWWTLRDVGGGARLMENPATRAEAIERIAGALWDALRSGRRVLVGFDFPFGYPMGVGERIAGAPGWAALWAALAAAVTDGPDNANNRLDAAGGFNAAWPGDGPFWGNGLKRDVAGLPRKKPRNQPGAPAEWRGVERLQRRRGGVGGAPKSVWQLAGAGAVGGQALTGIAWLERLRRDPRLAGATQIWPFETGLAAPTAPICIAEVYPSLLAAAPARGEVKDAAQVRTLAGAFAALDAAGALAPLFAGPSDAPAAERGAAEREEAWILGVADAPFSEICAALCGMPNP